MGVAVSSRWSDVTAFPWACDVTVARVKRETDADDDEEVRSERRSFEFKLPVLRLSLSSPPSFFFDDVKRLLSCSRLSRMLLMSEVLVLTSSLFGERGGGEEADELRAKEGVEGESIVVMAGAGMKLG